MTRATALLIVIATFSCAVASIYSNDPQGLSLIPRLSFNTTCNEIASSVSSASQIFYPESPGYEQDISHWASSSTQMATCSFEPGTAGDIGIALRILGQTRTPFAIKGGGHATNPAFSSTVGVQIAMYRFSDIVYDPEAQTATVGTGLIWDDVYAALEQYGVIVVGGRVPGVGVAGFTLGGGYSWLTNQHGLTLDNVQSYELVMPNGTALNVTETSSPDLFFALKGCQDNFGIVTRVTLKTYQQTQVWGGLIVYDADVINQASQEVIDFLANYTDPKAAIVPTYGFTAGALNLYVTLFYDAPIPPPGMFDTFLEIESSSKNISTFTYLDFVELLPANGSYGQRGIYNTVPVTRYSSSFLQTVVNETLYWGQKFGDSATFVSYDVEPFLPTLFSHNTTPTAYPPDRTQGLFPTLIYIGWESPEYDQVMQDAARTTARRLQAAALEHGDTYPDAASYPNYAIFDTSLVKLYGSNLPRLYEIKAAVDPENVMGLAGGFKL